MRKLLLLAFAAAFPLTASAQWTFDTVFPSDTLYTNGNGLHGVVVDDDGKVFLQDHNTKADTIRFESLGEDRAVNVLYVFNPDGTQVDGSPITFIDYADGVTPRDTLGGYTTLGSTGAPAFEERTGRGLNYCAADDAVYISQYDTLFKIDADTFEGLARTVPFPGASIGAVGLDENCNVTVQTVVAGGRSIVQYDPDLQAVTGTVGTASTFTRTTFTSPDGNTVLETAFDNPFTVVYQRPDEFSPYDSLGVTLGGLRVEASAVNPSTGYWWFSSGNPLNGGNDYRTIDPATGDSLETNYTLQAFYAFDPADLFDDAGEPVLNPTPVDSLLYSDPGSVPGGGDGVGVGRPRGIAFTPDGNTAYVALYNRAGAVQRFVRGGTAAEPGTFASGRLEQNRPNPFSSSTSIRFELDRASTVTLRVFDAMGRQVATLADGPLAAGPHAFRFDAGSLASGVYVYALNVEGEVSSRRMMVVR